MAKIGDTNKLLLECVGNTCKLMNVGKCSTAQPIQDIEKEFPINYANKELPDLSWHGWLEIMADSDEE